MKTAKVVRFNSDKHSFVDISGKHAEGFYMFNNDEEAENWLKQFGKAGYKFKVKWR